MTSSAFQVRKAVAHLRRGGLLAYPTEAVFGLGCDPLNPDAFDELLRLKGRAISKGVIVIGSCPEQVAAWVGSVPSVTWEQMRASWPGAVTWVVPASATVPDWIGGGRGTVAVRVPAHDLARRLCSAFGRPLVSTSANPTGLRPARSALEVRRYFGTRSLHVLAGQVGVASRPSTVRDALSGAVLRA